MSDIVQRLSGFCHTLRHDGVDYGDYIEEGTCPLGISTLDDLPPPEELATDAIGEVEGAVGGTGTGAGDAGEWERQRKAVRTCPNGVRTFNV